MAQLTYPAARAPLVETLPPTVPPSIVITHKPVKVKDIIQPVRIQRIEPGIEGGVFGGDEDGVEDGVFGGPPPPPAPPQNVPPTILEANRIRGTRLIEPDAPTILEIKKSGKDRLVASYKLCLDPRGAITTVSLLKSSGFPAYDTKLAREMRLWAYKPYLVNSQPVPVCTAVTFAYGATAP